ncbi:Uma2 family endonuclease [Streptacidiphilus jiangxiensis]|uniref:Endonuclease, Uma2 family (Restriction endonuclease fold) n=1 Tax=Streptacidiphilus jiangxiensis TaxID=235985 RepID=A0A1H7W3K1_STRJI|nr:Uma2 family endonuclease [Streptacidiphilus jiangxiensis]SEM16162.1 Endonuclease, Uma2 family (restriction endonuclease fold) [Streptacidiphilus jiangxiensis]
MGATMTVAPTDPPASPDDPECAEIPAWLFPPEGGWTAEHLDHLPNLPRHTELLDGSLVFMSPQRIVRMRVINLLMSSLMATCPDELAVLREMTVTLGKRDRPEPDLMVVPAEAVDDEQTTLQPEDVQLTVEVVSPESDVRDREVKPRKYAAAGIRYFWGVENEGGEPVVHTFELDEAIGAYAPTGVHRGKLEIELPYPIEVDLTDRRLHR